MYLSKRTLLVLLILFAISKNSHTQEIARFVDPFIGTGKSIAKTKWGNYGGTYPGAVSPWGMLQLTPETSTRPGESGYYYEDKEILSFSCVGHRSGYPNGSAGKINFLFEQKAFSHTNEEASAGYYKVRFDEGDEIELTATQRTGIIRYTPQNKEYTIGLFNAGEVTTHQNNEIHTSVYNGVIRFTTPWNDLVKREDTLFLTFTKREEPLLIKIGVSHENRAGSLKNIEYENPGWDFNFIREKAYKDWNNELKVIEIPTAPDEEKTKFYTALYHSFLMPWITSDVNAEPTYGGFSFWDTFRSLHPLLTLLKPEVQANMIRSVEKQYDRQGYLPVGPMTGFHVIPTVLDSYVKGITSFDTGKMYKAMYECMTGGNPRYGRAIYTYWEKGYLPATEEHSVNTTLEYAYNDWALAQFASIMGKQNEAAFFQMQSFNYHELYDVETQYMLPRNETSFIRNPGEMGYQESNKWTSTFFVPHNVQDLINIMGGDEHFVNHLEKCYEEGYIIHDNEPVLHYPYLFTYAGRPDLTVDKINDILHNNYFALPGGIPGNDDLGSMSSWYVFSTMGIYPACPGTDQYVLTTPAFDEVIIHLPDGNPFIISKKGPTNAIYYSGIHLNGEEYRKLYITHRNIIKGGKLEYTLSGNKTETDGFERPYSLTTDTPLFILKDQTVAHKEVMPDQENTIYFTLENKGVTGTKNIDIYNKGKVVASKRIKLNKDEIVTDSISFRLYTAGSNQLDVENAVFSIVVKDSPVDKPAIICHSIRSESLVKSGDSIHIEMVLQNVSGNAVTQQVPVYFGDKLLYETECTLDPGERITLSRTVEVKGDGFTELHSLNGRHLLKIYDTTLESMALYFDFDDQNDSLVQDKSGFDNHGQINGPIKWQKQIEGFSIQTGKNSYIELPASESLMNLGNTITLSTWMFPMKPTRGYVDFFTKGDYTLMKMEDQETLVFFAGGWGRGSCKVKVPDNWYNQWHHVVGVCSGDHIRLYIDGELMQELPVSGEIEYTEVPWNIGRNAEMPYSRFFEGQFDNLYIFKEPLSSSEIKELYRKEAGNFRSTD